MKVRKNDIKVMIRTGQLDDAKALLEIQREVVLEKEYLITETEEFQNTTEQQRDWIRKIIENERETIIVAELEENIVGWIALQSSSRRRLHHTGSFGMMIHKDYRGMGIGKLLIKELLNWAEKNPSIEKVSLGVCFPQIKEQYHFTGIWAL